MWTSVRPCATAVLFATIVLLLPQLDADDGNEPDDRSHDETRILPEFTQKVEQYNELLKQWRFDEAIALGKQARVLQPENPMAELMVLKAKFAKQDAINRLSLRFQATLAADVPEDPDGSDTIEWTLGIADETIRRFLYRKNEDAADGRRLLDASLERRIKGVDQICSLTDAQKRKLRLAGRGDIKRFFDRVETVRPKLQRAQALQDDDLPDTGLCGTGCLFKEDAIRPARRLGLF
jgi:hypothetical protein